MRIEKAILITQVMENGGLALLSNSRGQKPDIFLK